MDMSGFPKAGIKKKLVNLHETEILRIDQKYNYIASPKKKKNSEIETYKQTSQQLQQFNVRMC